MNISFLITVHNETDCFKKLLDILGVHLQKFPNDEVVILDDYSDNPQTIEIINSYKEKGFKHFQHKLERDYGNHKTWGSNQCKNEMIFQIDADEYPSEFLLENIHELLESNSNVDLFWIPRVNIIRDLNDECVKRWGWRVGKIDKFPGLPIINWPDKQSRIYRNKPEIKWDRKLHEYIVGAKTVAHLPDDTDWALIHDKSMEKQILQNERYMKEWSLEDNIRK